MAEVLATEQIPLHAKKRTLREVDLQVEYPPSDPFNYTRICC